MGFTFQEYKRLMSVACEHTKNKKECGSVIKIFAAKLRHNEVVPFILSIILRDNFLDLQGSVFDFLNEIDLSDKDRESLLESLKERYTITDEGAMLEFDADATGNLE